jgi:hypothetical protein
MEKPEIMATFDLDPSGEPEALAQGDLKHYRIRLQVKGAPEDTYAVTYLLDESYYDSVRESLAKDQSFEERLTSYGDYTVQAKIRTKHGTLLAARPLSAALEAGHKGTESSAVQKALSSLRVK